MTNKKSSKRGPRVQNPKSKENLISLADRSPQERKEIASKGGRASAQQYNDNLKLQKLAQEVIRSKLPEGELKKRLTEAGIKPENATRGAGMIMALTDRVIATGDVRAFEAIRDTAGEKPNPDTSVNFNINKANFGGEFVSND